ncbi:MAG: response regulator transcription factor [Methylotenera sp.]|jgi:DNA-binding NarL/FixJ family response regulator|nr:response regulator transcription factor [Methylotenera sp.]
MRSRVMVMARHQLLRAGLASLLQSRQDVELVAQAGDGQEGVRLAARLQPDVVLMDMQLPGLNSVDATQRILGTQANCRVICLAAEEPPQMLRAALQAGARGMISKDCSAEELMRAIEAVLQRQLYISPALADAAVIACFEAASAPSARDAFVRLTPKEREVVQLLAEGLATKQVASRLGLSYKTVATHREHVVAKLGLRGVADITRYAIREGLVRP